MWYKTANYKTFRFQKTRENSRVFSLGYFVAVFAVVIKKLTGLEQSGNLSIIKNDEEEKEEKKKNIFYGFFFKAFFICFDTSFSMDRKNDY